MMNQVMSISLKSRNPLKSRYPLKSQWPIHMDTLGNSISLYSKQFIPFGPFVSPHVYIIPKYMRRSSPAAQIMDRLIGTSFVAPHISQITLRSVDFQNVAHKKGNIGALDLPHQLLLRSATEESVGLLPVSVVSNISWWVDVRSYGGGRALLA